MGTRTAKSGADSSAQVLRRRSAVPGGRAIVGALLVTVAVLGVFAASSTAGDGPSSSYVTVAGPLPQGHVLEAADLRLTPIDLPVPTATISFDSVDEAVGGVLLVPLEGDELLARSSVLAADRDAGAAGPAAEFSFPVERERAVDGAIQPGELVDVLATYGTTEEGYTSVVTRGARVTAIASAGSDTLSSPGTLVLTLSLSDPDDVLELAHAAEVASVTVVRTTRGDPARPSADRYSPEDDTP